MNMERKRSSGFHFRRIFTVAFLLFLALWGNHLHLYNLNNLSKHTVKYDES